MTEECLGRHRGCSVLAAMPDATPAPEVIVRPGTAADIDGVHRLVRELADHVRAADEVATTPAVFSADFADDWFRLLVAEDEATGQLLGLMLYYRTYSTWKGRMTYLEDFVVSQAARRRGVGQALWKALVEVCRANGSTSLKWQVADFNEGAKAFYRKMGAEFELGYENGRLYL